MVLPGLQSSFFRGLTRNPSGPIAELSSLHQNKISFLYYNVIDNYHSIA